MVLEAARQFLRHRLQKQDSTILLAHNDGHMVGFAQLYPSFSSVSMQPVWILNDLFVEAVHRRQGVAKLLLQAAEQQARAAGAIRITLVTQRTNRAAQALYESLGYSKDEVFDHYLLRL